MISKIPYPHKDNFYFAESACQKTCLLMHIDLIQMDFHQRIPFAKVPYTIAYNSGCWIENDFSKLYIATKRSNVMPHLKNKVALVTQGIIMTSLQFCNQEVQFHQGKADFALRENETMSLTHQSCLHVY